MNRSLSRPRRGILHSRGTASLLLCLPRPAADKRFANPPTVYNYRTIAILRRYLNTRPVLFVFCSPGWRVGPGFCHGAVVGGPCASGSFALGAHTLREFALALFIGIALGTYSSIFVAAPVLAIWKEREPDWIAERKRVERKRGGNKTVVTAASVPTKVETVPAAPSAPTGASGAAARAPRKRKKRR